MVKDGVVRAVVLNSGGANCYTGPDGFQTTHAVAERVAGRLGIGAGRRRRLLDRADRARQRPRRAAGRGRCRPSGSGRGRRAGCGTRDHDHRHRGQAGRRRRWRLVASAEWPRERACSRRSWPRCWWCSPPTPWCPRPRLDSALRAATRVSFDRLDSDGCMSTNDTVTVLASGASGVAPRAGGLHRGTHPGLHRPGHAAAARRGGCRPRDRDHRRFTRPVRTTPWRSLAAWRGATCSRPRSSATTPTGDGCWPASAPRRPPSTQPTSTSP